MLPPPFSSTPQKLSAYVRSLKATSSPFRMTRAPALLLNDLPGPGMDLLVLNLRGVPAAAEGFDQIDRGDHLLAEKLHRSALVGQERRLRGDDVEEVGQTSAVTVGGDLQGALRVLHGGGLGCRSLRQRVQP